MECLAVREQRADIDLVADVTESQLKKVHVHVRVFYYLICLGIV